MSKNVHLDRALARGCYDSIAFASGRAPTSRKPHTLAWVGGYALALVSLAGLIALLARMAA
jgi:hypothetical protein